MILIARSAGSASVATTDPFGALSGRALAPALSEQGRADAHRGGAEADGGLEVAAHPHGKPGQAVARGDPGEQGEVRAGRLALGRDAHQPLDRKAVRLAAL